MKNVSKYFTGLSLILLVGCAQTSQVDPITTASVSTTGSTENTVQSSSIPTTTIETPAQQLGSKVVPLSDGKAKIIVTTLNSVNIRNKHACELGRFAQSRNATSVLTPLQTRVKTDIEGGQTYRIVEQEFNYYTAGQPAPSGTQSTASLLGRCGA